MSGRRLYPPNTAHKVRRTLPKVQTVLFTLGVAEDLAAKRGIPVIEAFGIWMDVCQIIGDRLLSAKPIGIPHVGMLFVRYHENRKVCCNLVGTTAINEKHLVKSYKYPVYSSLFFKPEAKFKDRVRDEAPYRGDLTAQAERERKTFNLRFRRLAQRKLVAALKERGIYVK